MSAILMEMVVPTLFLAPSFADQTQFRRLSPTIGKKGGLRSSSLETTSRGSNRLHLFDHLYGSVLFDDNFARAGRNIAGRGLAAWPADRDLRRRSSRGQHLHGTVLRPISAAGMNFSRRTGLSAAPQSHHRTEAGRIARRTLEPYSQPRLSPDVAIDFGLRPVLRHHQVHPSVSVDITQHHWSHAPFRASQSVFRVAAQQIIFLHAPSRCQPILVVRRSH